MPFSSEAVWRTLLDSSQPHSASPNSWVPTSGKLFHVSCACRYNLLRRAVVELPPQLPTQQHVRCTIKLHDPERYQASISVEQHWLQVSIVPGEMSCIVQFLRKATGALCQFLC